MKILSLVALAFVLVPCAAEVPVKEINRDGILAAGPEWQQNYDRFQTRSELIDALKSKLGKGLRIEVYLGLWCPDSQNHVPAFLKILDQVGGPVPVRYFSVWKKPSPQIRYYADKARVERIPTFIFFRDEREIGRIVENPKIGLCEDMIAVLSQ
jgi:hypothetical protein